MKVAAIQSNYIPWRGYFDIIGAVDLFIFYDDVQYTYQDWRNRNLIKTPTGLQWLSIPCGTNNKQLIYEVNISNNHWQKKHWHAIKFNYSRAKFFKYYRPFFEDIYLNNTWEKLSDFNQYLIKRISKEILNFDARFEDSRIFQPDGKKEDRVLDLLNKCGATEYLSGPSARNYLSEEKFQSAGIKLEWMDYNNYPEYNQLFPPFKHNVSIVDLILNEGANASKYMKFFNSNNYETL